MSSVGGHTRIAEWPTGCDALVLPGLPGRSEESAPEDYALYPGSVIDVVKLLRERGLSIDYAPADRPRAEVELKAAELWAPIIVFAQDVLVAGGAHALVEVAWDRLRGRRGGSILHLRVGKRDGETGNVEWFESHGRATDVLDAFIVWSEQDPPNE